MNQTLKNKSALVTGGSRGIGAGIVKRLAAEGANVVFTYVSSPEKAETFARETAAATGAKVLAIKTDSADAAAVSAAVDYTVKELGSLDILVNSAGLVALGPIDKVTLEDFDRVMAVNVRGVFAAIKAAVPHMKEGGRIINIGSCNAERMPFEGGSIYAMSKSALTGLVKGISRDIGKRGITINNIQPGPIDTDANPASGPFAATMLGLMASPRYGTAAEVAAMVAYLAGPEAGYITGAGLMIDGGFTA